MGTSSTSNITVLAVTIEGETFAYLSCQFLPCYACHFFEAIFFFFFFGWGNHSESTNRTICPIVLKTKVLIIF